MNEQDVCANCGKTYDEHLLWDGKCVLGSITGWFPKKLADAIESKASTTRTEARK